MKLKQFRKSSKLILVCVFLTLAFLAVENSYAQGKSGLGAIKAMGPKGGKRPVPGKMGGLLGVRSNDKPKASKLTVEVTSSPGTVRRGQGYTFTAKAKGGNPPYSYSWSGVNQAGNGKSTGMLTRSHMNASFKHLGSSTITVRVIDADNNFAQKSVRVRVVP